MKKKILTFALALSMMASYTAVFADTNNTDTDTNNTSKGCGTRAADDTQKDIICKYIKSDFTIEAAETNDTSIMIAGKDEHGEPVNALVFEQTLIFDNSGEEVEKLDKGMSVSVYTRADAPMTLQYPPTYRPDVIIVNTDKEGFVDVDEYDGEGVNSANTISTDKINEKGSFVVFYTNSTRSIPAVVNPSKVVKLENNIFSIENKLEDNAEDNTEDKEGNDVLIPYPTMQMDEKDYSDVNAVVINGKERLDINSVIFNGTFMLPVRDICEHLGYEVSWDSELSAVTVGTIQMGVNFTVGKNAYNKARMTAQTLSSAPIIVSSDERGGLTYVPVEFFSEILDLEITKDGTAILIYDKEA